MSICEDHPPLRQSVDVGCLHQRVPPEATDPVVQIVNHNEQHVGLGLHSSEGEG